VEAAHWVSLASLTVIAGLAAVSIVWLVRHQVRKRRRARHLARLAAHYRKQPPALPAGQPKPIDPPGQEITVAQLIARTQAEGLPIRLNWDANQTATAKPDNHDWPTAELPPVRPEGERTRRESDTEE
jgi:hypothetical protein